jgi:quinol monooxygenase YgiN
MTARPGKGDELVDVLLSATTDMGPATSENCVVFLVGRSATNKDVVHVTEGWTTKEAHAEMFASEAGKAHLAKALALISDTAQYQDEVPVGWKFRS